jgi:hypothetical protein
MIGSNTWYSSPFSLWIFFSFDLDDFQVLKCKLHYYLIITQEKYPGLKNTLPFGHLKV